MITGLFIGLVLGIVIGYIYGNPKYRNNTHNFDK